MPGMIVHAGHLLDDLRHARQRPQIGPEPVGTRPVPERGIHATTIGVRQSRPASRPPGAPQRGRAARLPLPIPAADALATDGERAGDGGGDLPRGEQSRRPSPALCQRVEIPPRSNLTTSPHSHTVFIA